MLLMLAKAVARKTEHVSRDLNIHLPGITTWSKRTCLSLLGSHTIHTQDQAGPKN